ncbi:MAG: site-specific integrase [Candidatus Gastranaerophilaceae bacterium]
MKNFSKHTAKAYCSDVLSFLVWMDETSCEDVNFSKVREYLHFIQKFNYKNDHCTKNCFNKNFLQIFIS